MHYIYYILLFCFLTLSIHTQTVTLTFKYFAKKYNVSLPIGSEETRHFFGIDIRSNVTRITNSLLGDYYSKTQKSLESRAIYINGHKILCNEKEDMITFDRNQTYFQLCLTEDLEFLRGSEGASLALSYDMINKEHSLTHILKKAGLINDLRFTLRKGYDSVGMMYFGTIPYKEIINRYHGSCYIAGKTSNWDCFIDKVFIGNSTQIYYKKPFFPNMFYSSFSTTHLYIEAPKAFFSYMIEHFFQDSLDKNYCYIKDDKMLVCTCNIFADLPSITFVINNLLFSFNASDLIFRYDSKCLYVITKNQNNENEWNLGIRFFFGYIVSFSYEVAQVSFYSKSPFVSYHDSLHSSKRYHYQNIQPDDNDLNPAPNTTPIDNETKHQNKAINNNSKRLMIMVLIILIPGIGLLSIIRWKFDKRI